MTVESLSSYTQQSCQLLEELNTALDKVKSEYPVTSRYLWVKNEIEQYEEAVRRIESISVNARTSETEYQQALLSSDSE
jgi:hypothetical protein